MKYIAMLRYLFGEKRGADRREQSVHRDVEKRKIVINGY
jgi:hypothetical protein